MKILVSGANGFVGSALCPQLRSAGHDVVACVRRASGVLGEIVVGSIDSATQWTHAIDDCEAVVHLAARVHVMNDKAADSLAEFRRVNVGGTLNLMRQAAAAGVRRFVFVSSVKVHGESTKPGQPFREIDALMPIDAYGQSKLEAEQGLWQLAAQTGVELVIVRPPLVYGPGVRANFQLLMRAVECGYPLPLVCVSNRRSLVNVENLILFIMTCVIHPAAANQAFLISDGEDLSTPELVTELAAAMGRVPRLFYLPLWLLKLGAMVVRRRSVLDRICSSLQLDISKARLALGWVPPISWREGLRRMVIEQTVKR